jgi:hypothetical protein
MPVSDTPRRAGPFLGDGAATIFPFGFRIFANSDLLVQSTTGSVIATLSLGTDYSVTLNADQTNSPGGTVITTLPLAVGTNLAIVGGLHYTQTSKLPQGGNYSAVVVQNALDRLTMLIQQLVEQLGRTFRAPPGDQLSDLPSSSARANTVLGFDGNGNVVPQIPASGSAAAVMIQYASSLGSSLMGFLQLGASAFARTVQAKLRERVSLEDFGGVADWNGTTGTDNLAAFNAAMAALPAAGGTIELGHGAYALTAPTTSGYKHIRVFGRGGSEAQNSTGASELILLGNSTFNINSPRLILEHLNIRCAPGHTAGAVWVGATAGVNANSFQARGVGFYSAGLVGLRIGNDAGANCNSWHLDSCKFFNNGSIGFYVSDGVYPTPPNANAGSWDNCVAQANGNDGIRIGNAIANAFFGGVVENNTGAGARLMGAGSSYNYFSGIDFDSGNTAGNLLIQTGAVANRVDCQSLVSTAISDSGTDTLSMLPSSTVGTGYVVSGVGRFIGGRPGGATDFYSNLAASSYLRFGYGPSGFTDAAADILIGSLGLNLGKSSGGKIGLYGNVPVLQQTTAVASSTAVANSGTAVNLATTFDGYTLPQIVKALRNIGVLA